MRRKGEEVRGDGVGEEGGGGMRGKGCLTVWGCC